MNKIIFLTFSTAISFSLLTGCSEESKFKGKAPSAKAGKNAEPEKKTVDESKSEKKTETIDDSVSKPDPITVEEEVLKSLPKFGMLVNDFECGFCHMKLIGDMASTSSVPAARADSIAVVNGDWLVRGKLDINAEGAKISVEGDKKEDYEGQDVPKNFPVIDMASAQSKAKGSISGLDVKGEAVKISKSVKGNVTLNGSAAKPIIISGDVFVDGDLIILGEYQGVGTIYASGSIYIPFDLKAQKSAFPFSEVKAEAVAKAMQSVDKKADDALGLAAGKSIFIGSLSKLTHPEFNKLDPEGHRLDFKTMYGWFGEGDYNKLLKFDQGCSKRTVNFATLNVVDAFLYARRGIDGLISESSFSIRGGMIAESFNLINGMQSCSHSKGTNPIHGRESNASYIEYDWRLYTGKLPILERLGEVMQKK